MDLLANRRWRAYIRAILIGFAGRTKQEEWAKNPLFSFVASLYEASPRPKPARSEPA